MSYPGHCQLLIRGCIMTFRFLECLMYSHDDSSSLNGTLLQIQSNHINQIPNHVIDVYTFYIVRMLNAVFTPSLHMR